MTSFTFIHDKRLERDGETGFKHIRRMNTDSKGKLWTGNIGIGVLLYDGTTIINFTQIFGLGSRENRGGEPLPGDAKDGSPSLERVYAIGVDPAGKICFGLQGTQGSKGWPWG